jgi:outer membrane beta-barrel protein
MNALIKVGLSATALLAIVTSPMTARAEGVEDEVTSAADRKAQAAKAEADHRNSLAAQPAVRHRKLLVRKRFELAPLFESTINADFRHIIGGGLKLEYHFTDMISVGGVGVLATSVNTKLIDRIIPTLPTVRSATETDSRLPTQDELTSHLNTMPLHGALYLNVTPWYGKLAAFGKSFLNFDFYFQAGLGFAQLKSTCSDAICSDKSPGKITNVNGMDKPPDFNPNNDAPLNSGTRLGLYLGGGIHVFLNDFVALDLTVRDYAFVDNPSGADFNADLFVSDADNRFLHHLFFGLGVSIMLPTAVKRTP